MDAQFRQSPLDMSKKNITLTFTRTYNSSLDFIKFRENSKLMPKGFYHLPACLYHEMNDLISHIEMEQDDHINKNNGFITQRDLCLLQEIESPTQVVTMNHDLDEESSRDEICTDCENLIDECHRHLFGAYCTANVERVMNYFPAAMTADAAKKVFIKWYNSALHFHDYENNEVGGKYKSRCFLLPPPCLEYDMNKVINASAKKQESLVHKHVERYTEWKESEMNLYGLDMGI